MLHVYYRFCPSDRPEVRPVWFSKKLCLASFVLSLNNYLANGGEEKPDLWLGIDKFELLMADDKKMIEELSSKFDIKVENLTTNSNTKAYSYMVKKACEARDDDEILFVEDDYLWLPEAIFEMVETMRNISDVDYLTPYDHPVRYDDTFCGGVDLPHWGNKIFQFGNRHYRSQESTCMTYMTLGKVLKEDLSLHLEYSPEDKKCPNDRELFRRLQQLGGYNDLKQRRLLVGPMPSLATHLHVPYLAPVIDWEAKAEDVNTQYQKIISNL